MPSKSVNDILKRNKSWNALFTEASSREDKSKKDKLLFSANRKNVVKNTVKSLFSVLLVLFLLGVFSVLPFMDSFLTNFSLHLFDSVLPLYAVSFISEFLILRNVIKQIRPGIRYRAVATGKVLNQIIETSDELTAQQIKSENELRDGLSYEFILQSGFLLEDDELEPNKNPNPLADIYIQLKTISNSPLKQNSSNNPYTNLNLTGKATGSTSIRRKDRFKNKLEKPKIQDKPKNKSWFDNKLNAGMKILKPYNTKSGIKGFLWLVLTGVPDHLKGKFIMSANKACNGTSGYIEMYKERKTNPILREIFIDDESCGIYTFERELIIPNEKPRIFILKKEADNNENCPLYIACLFSLTGLHRTAVFIYA